MNTPPTEIERNLAMVSHLGFFVGFVIPIPFGNVILPLVIWLLKREESSFIDEQGKEALNHQISMTIYAAICIVLALVLIGFVIGAILWIAELIFTIQAAKKAQNGERVHYPITIRFIS
ncbi:DUF4870 domain-containing protein [Spirulina sp. CS-785/01]|uniref:DUF4870 domain-containing protein n=1 Tax=Spirulina sp. CS-785/01 TaxID=3021716 RepID=UPI00232F4CB1|nr:DUF4870 domain-containing protein [Spirulina sp. CS-785/01]MDB9314062.1 DUF4870 domain-containing protein [Spirulina sp. CS-785/01]